MKAPDESGINKDFTEKSTDWIATAVKRCTDAVARSHTGQRLIDQRDSSLHDDSAHINIKVRNATWD